MRPPHRPCCRVLTTRRKVHALNWTRNPLPISRSKLVHEVSKKLNRYLNDMAVRSHPVGTNLAIAHKCTVDGYSGWIYRGSVGDRQGFHAHREYVPRQSCFCIQRIITAGNMGGRPFGLKSPRGAEMNEVWYLSRHTPPLQVRNERHLYLFCHAFLCPTTRAPRTEYTLTAVSTGIL